MAPRLGQRRRLWRQRWVRRMLEASKCDDDGEQEWRRRMVDRSGWCGWWLKMVLADGVEVGGSVKKNDGDESGGDGVRVVVARS
ncbi:hypothetical protein PIB30_103800 [Stylosanthes scabra]|uniref:Uncharacterized protein n=1 Tax=Stylosanthes scabra TaxID=79078 RepID=A0ABU6V059_9FABA|nr:hypothetical protein [Stylosanthes scabra]